MSQSFDPNFVLESPAGAEVVISGRRYLYFSGTGYLGLQGHPAVIRAVISATQQYGVSSATSRRGMGYTKPLADVEQQGARFFGCEEVFYTISGYVGGMILLEALATSFDAVFLDEHAHYSILDAVKGAGLPCHHFAHAQPADLSAQLKKHLRPNGRPLLMTDGVFPILGVAAPLADYQRVLGEYVGSAMIVDEAHSLGVLGENGRGAVEHHGLTSNGVNAALACRDEDGSHGPLVYAYGTLAKGLGGYGGIIAGSTSLISHLKRTSTFFNGATPIPAPIAAGSAVALQIAIDQPQRRQRLVSNAQQLRDSLRKLGLPITSSPSSIICIKLDSAEKMRRIQQQLRDHGVVIAYVQRYSGVSAPGALRIAVSSEHTPEMLQTLIEQLKAAL